MKWRSNLVGPRAIGEGNSAVYKRSSIWDIIGFVIIRLQQEEEAVSSIRLPEEVATSDRLSHSLEMVLFPRSDTFLSGEDTLIPLQFQG